MTPKTATACGTIDVTDKHHLGLEQTSPIDPIVWFMGQEESDVFPSYLSTDSNQMLEWSLLLEE